MKSICILVLAALASTLSPVGAAIQPAAGCTVLTIAKDGRVFFGGNDDYINRDSYYWVDPSGPGRYGVVWIGEPDNVQQGVNERGLAYDANGLPRVAVNPHAERSGAAGGYASYPSLILHECASVEEVVAWVNSHRWRSFMHDQMHFADASGDAVVISAGVDGELVFTRKPRGDGLLVSTNFNVANPANATSYPCWRYDRASELLRRLMDGSHELTAPDAAGVLDAVHMGAGASWTVSSLVADLTAGVIYLYYFHQFDRPVELSISEELAHPREPGPLSALFPEDVQREAARRYRLIQAERTRYLRLSLPWLAAVLASLVLVLTLPGARRRERRFWTPAAIVLGPLALPAWIAAGRGRSAGRWRLALVEASGDVLPSVIAFVAVMSILVFSPSVQRSPPLQLLFLIGLPFVFSLLANGLTTARTSDEGRARFLGRRWPQALVAANIGAGGIGAIALPLTVLSLRKFPLTGFAVWPLLVWWAIAVLGALLGVLLLLLYESWAVGAGYQAWSVHAGSREGPVRTPPWRRAWWWALISVAILLGGLKAGAAIQKALLG